MALGADGDTLKWRRLLSKPQSPRLEGDSEPWESRWKRVEVAAYA